jgi:Zn finger protein HypA/HybF involved in hydrogenase expression
MTRKAILEVEKLSSDKYNITIHCEDCVKTETQTVNKGTNVYCPRCGSLIMDGFDWEDIEESEIEA